MWITLLPLTVALSVAIIALIPAFIRRIGRESEPAPDIETENDLWYEIGRLQGVIGDTAADKSIQAVYPVNEPEMVHIPVEGGDSAPDGDNMPEYTERDRILTEMPQILNPIDPMDGIIPDIDVDWAVKLEEQGQLPDLEEEDDISSP